jgi:hypothetical protein
MPVATERERLGSRHRLPDCLLITTVENATTDHRTASASLTNACNFLWLTP